MNYDRFSMFTPPFSNGSGEKTLFHYYTLFRLGGLCFIEITVHCGNSELIMLLLHLRGGGGDENIVLYRFISVHIG